MRVISGKYRGRRLSAVPGMATRPTTDKVKESMFNMIGPYFDGGNSLDLFGGSGALSIEGVSRGIGHAVIVDRQYAAIKTIKHNISLTKDDNLFTVIKKDANVALSILKKGDIKFDYVFLDPPYAKQKIVNNIQKMVSDGLLNREAIIVCETNQEANLPDEIDGFKLLRRQDYGITVVTIYQYKGV